MKIEIFEKAQLSSMPTELDIMTDYMLRALAENGAEIIRYEQSVNPQAFERIEGYALPVIMVDGEVLCAGAYDFSQIDINAFRSRPQNSSPCSTCSKSSGCANCSIGCQKGECGLKEK